MSEMSPASPSGQSDGDRTPAERRVDELACELRKLRALPAPSREQRARLWEIESRKLPSAWRAVHDMRAGRR